MLAPGEQPAEVRRRAQAGRATRGQGPTCFSLRVQSCSVRRVVATCKRTPAPSRPITAANTHSVIRSAAVTAVDWPAMTRP